ncbi:FecR domain-containing protein [Methylococcus sp. EFPC2]|uniref:FecR domain-containing protein n=1 Tax=Methylococcus sp. EFPC2 TaxID=2812648 RepID=UPI0019675AD7|nr:FecR domain-containing protein [Methylococcus sp. EFPC2]QSA98166.1 FecR domain-containing protein [Methylococcus sp. EFPC2]
MRFFRCGPLFLLASVLIAWAPDGSALEQCEETAGRFASIEGEVEVLREAGGSWHPGDPDAPLCEGDTIQVGLNGRVAVLLVNNTVLRIDQDTQVRLVNIATNSEEISWVDLSKGAIYTFSRQPQRLKVITRSLMALIKGTEFYVRAEDERSYLSVLEGSVQVSNEQGAVMAMPGSEVVAENGAKPRLRTVVHPRDAVQWALYYPPLFAVLDGHGGHLPKDLPAFLAKAVEQAGVGDTASAFKTLAQLPLSERDGRFFLYRAALQLSVGRAAESAADIREALRRDGDSALAYALRALIAVVQNRKKQALEDARRADGLASSVATKIALSYALQADFQLEAARDELSAAVRTYPDASLAWARLGELDLMLGNRRSSLEAVHKAVALSPNSARAHLVLGFSALAEFRRSEAKASFARAIALDSAEPLAHLGLGLAKISDGELVEGRREIEIAVALDSNSALLRAYLGKAYFTEKRAPLDATQLQLAKSLDELDPTAYLYDGIRKQTENRPVEALRDLQASIDRNDYRAVYRGRLLLDKDRAARGASLARAYRDLGFTELGLREAGRSLDLEPDSAAAHRFLSDSYQGVRRREISRVSELLQAQLMQDVNLNPIQPSLAETNLNIISFGGPAAVGFNEFTPLFERNSVKLDTSGFGGSNGTYGGEGSVTALYDRFSFGAGAFHYQSDGWRPNNGLNQQVYDIFAQTALSPEFNVQVEFRRRVSKEGDLAFNFDPAEFLRDKTNHREQDTTRLGLRYTPEKNSNFLFSYIHSDRTQREQVDAVPIDPTTTLSSNQRGNDVGDQYEGQYLYQRERLNVVAGFAHSLVAQRADGAVTFFDTTFPEPIVNSFDSVGEIRYTSGYLYGHFRFPSPITWTLGFNYADYQEGLVSVSNFNPKFGVRWDLSEDFRLRAATFTTVKPALVNNRTIEPTQVAGFNQFIDDINGTKSTSYAGGFDWRLTRGLFLGGEISWRHLDDPVLKFTPDGGQAADLEDRREEVHSLYLFWTPEERWAVKAQFVYDRYRSEPGVVTDSGQIPQLSETLSAPVTLSYFHPTGFFGRLGGSFVHQRVLRAATAPQISGNDSFFLMDADLGYRLPRRLGAVSVGVKNLLDSRFRYQDDSYREFRDEPATGPYFPDRIVMGRIVLNF